MFDCTHTAVIGVLEMRYRYGGRLCSSSLCLLVFSCFSTASYLQSFWILFRGITFFLAALVLFLLQQFALFRVSRIFFGVNGG